MDPVVDTAAAPAQPTPIPPAPAPSGESAASTRPDFAAFDRAETDKALGRKSDRFAGAAVLPAQSPAQSPAAVPDPDDAPALDAKGAPITGTDGKQISKRQAATNARIQDAIDRGIAGERQRADAAEKRIADLEARLSGKQPAAEPAKPQAEETGQAKPKLADFEAAIGTTYETYAAAVEAYQDARDDWKDQVTAARTAREQAETAVNTRLTSHREREQAMLTEVPDYMERTAALRAALHPESTLTQALYDSPKSERLLLHFADNQADLERIGKLGQTNLPAALRELGKIEAKYDAPADPPAAPLPRKLVSSAPEPPTTLGSRPAEPANASKAAVAAGNFAAFHEEETAKALARVRRR